MAMVVAETERLSAVDKDGHAATKERQEEGGVVD
jgi:hypothetical protein